LTSTSPEGSGFSDLSAQIIDSVRSHFDVTSELFLDNGALEFTLNPVQRDTKSSFLSLLNELSRFGKTAVLRKKDTGELQLLIVNKQAYQKQRLNVPIILLFATIIAIFADGMIRTLSGSNSVTGVVTLSNAVLFSGLYVVALLGILGTHEMGHKIASWVHKMNSSWPYFIPGIPSVIPTFGAVIRAADPPPNRDSLFDLGLSGPVAGLAITVIVSVFAAVSVHLIPMSSFPAGTTFSSGDLYTSWLVSIFQPGSGNMVLGGSLFQLLYFAYSLGFFVTFINLLPAWQLDGGHIANSAVSPRVHKYLTIASILIMIALGLVLMALFVIFLYGRAPSLRPLDDVSSLSRTRKVIFVLTWILAASIGAFVILNNPIFSFAIFKL
jgi:membrane-associated protease RseP (regulator of RpoE activity)